MKSIKIVLAARGSILQRSAEYECTINFNTFQLLVDKNFNTTLSGRLILYETGFHLRMVVYLIDNRTKQRC